MERQSLIPALVLGLCAWNSAQAGGIAPHNDMDGDGHSDLLWRNASTGADVVWRSASASTPLPVQGVTDPDWLIVGTADFDFDLRADILWRNRATGLVVTWSGAVATDAETPVFDWSDVGTYSPQWEIAGIGDFDGDGYPDIFWRNSATGSNAVAYYDWFDGYGYFVMRTNPVANLRWHVAGVGDFDGDGRSEVLWRNTSSGANAVWQLPYNALVFTGVALRSVDPAWEVAGTGDFDGDGTSDIFWRNGDTGSDALWNSGQYANSKALATVTDLDWRVATTGDFDGDGTCDVFWRNASSGANVIWRSADHGARMAVTGVTNLAWAPVR